MKNLIISVILAILLISVGFNLFLYSNSAATCKTIDARWKADLLYKMGHKKLDGDKDGIPCENLPYNHDR